ncbi:MAG: acetyl-CoA decarbonylase/synthase complex subunit alpha/beta [Candidatus Erginobacter occultus]|nr:acetyl-CoA decarbonylase/synthase complex subunit alpha/beta [Candidatus Erginobacter occultus]
MSDAIAGLARDGAEKIYRLVEERLERTVAEQGGDAEVRFPGTNYFFPLAFALLGSEVRTLGDLPEILAAGREILASGEGTDPVTAIGRAGEAVLMAGEIELGLRYLAGEEPQKDCPGFFSDDILRTLGIQLVDGRMAGFACLLGAAPDSETAVRIARGFQQKNVLVFAGGESGGVSVIDQLIEQKVATGWESYLVPYGRDTFSALFVLNWAIRAPLTYGGLKKGEKEKILDYCRHRVPALVVVLGEIDEFKVAAGAAALRLGVPLIVDSPVPEILEPGLCLHESLVSEPDHKRIVPRAIEVRGIKIRVEEIPVPVPYAAAFEGERVRKENLQVQFGGKFSPAFEYLKVGPTAAVEDGKIEVIGPGEESVAAGESLPLGITVTVAGRKCEKDYASILERQIHTFINGAMGVMHVGQRDILWLRISREAYESGFRLRHLGEIIVARLHNDFGAIVDKVEVRIDTTREEVERGLKEARRAYDERDERMAGMTDEAVDTFYSCTLCQSFAPNHVCVISPERLGLCGAYSWLDGKAAYEITPTGPNQPVEKGKLLDEKIGQWEGINSFVYGASHRALEKFSVYSMMIDPMTSCGCFECILAVIPETGGVMAVNREFTGMTPSGMDFITLAGMVGGGVQTPGFLGVGKLYLVSPKFISGDGGLARLVWLPKELKEALRDRLIRRGEEIGIPDFIELLADETIAENSADLLEFLQMKNHPALKMEPMF